jgi:phosphoribosylaminoimidazolecarboxamide formyltransferase / IMP cyclohydrolase
MTVPPKRITGALLSVYNKNRLDAIVTRLENLGVTIYSTGGTAEYIRGLGIQAETVESVTGFPSILGGRVKTLHPKIFGGILYRRNHEDDCILAEELPLPSIDLVIVDLYPFESTLASGASDAEILEQIDVGGISLIRAAAKNYQDVLVIASSERYDDLIQLLDEKKGYSNIEERQAFATHAFHVTSHYDCAIFHYFNKVADLPTLKISTTQHRTLRYGENPHQAGKFFGIFEDAFEQLHGKEISYNNLTDLDAAVRLIADLPVAAFAIFKHTNACGVAVRDTLKHAWEDALAGDPVSAFGGVLATNIIIDEETAEKINNLFFELILAPGYKKTALEILKQKKNRIILQQRNVDFPPAQFRSLLHGIIWQEKDREAETQHDLIQATVRSPSDEEVKDLLFANIIAKHIKSNAIVLVKNRMMIGSGGGQTSRVDAVKQALAKAKEFHFELKNSVMASDGFFPFADCAELAHNEGVRAIIQPGGSVRDQETIDYCNANGIAMVLTGIRHFKH